MSPSKSRLLAVAAGAVLLLTGFGGAVPENGSLQIHFVNVGQGDAAIVITPNGTVVGIDAGPDGTACSTLVDYYTELGVSEIEYLVTSHYHADSIGCVPDLVARFDVNHVLDRGGSYKSATFDRYAAATAGKRVTAKVGRTFTLDTNARLASNVELEVIAVKGKSRAGKVRVPASYENDRGVVVALRMDDFDALFGGDISGVNDSGYKDVESVVGSAVGPVEVYKVHHNGSMYSSSREFMETIRPVVSVLSVGPNNSFGHPASDAIDRIHQNTSGRTFWTSKGKGQKPLRRFDSVCGTVVVEAEPDTGSFAVTCKGKETDFEGNGGGEDAPGTPRQLTAAVDGTSVALNWQPPNSGGEPTSYDVVIGTTPNGSNVATANTAATNRTFGGLTEGTYYARVRANNEAGASSFTNPVEFEIAGAPPGVTAPGVPVGIAVNVDGQAATVSWEPGGGGTPDAYDVEIGTSPGSSNAGSASTGGTNHTFQGLAAGTYYARVRARNSAGASSYTNSQAFNIETAPQPPGIPQNLGVSVDGQNANVTWSPGGGGAPSEYDVQIGSTPGGADVLDDSTGGTNYAVGGLAAGTYYARVRARNAAGTSDWTSSVAFTIEESGGGGGPYNFTVVLDVVGEQVHITNNGGGTVDMTGWTLEDQGPNFTFEFPDGFTLGPGGVVTVTSGNNPRNEPPRYIVGWNRDVWNNTGDVATLRDADGNIVAQGADG